MRIKTPCLQPPLHGAHPYPRPPTTGPDHDYDFAYGSSADEQPAEQRTAERNGPIAGSSGGDLGVQDRRGAGHSTASRRTNRPLP